ncbi:adrenoceptor alpha 1Aa [Tachysurus vachellii]|nr:adrenoceptor alpha 1Aa [Tachysurus vachellii]
MKLIFIAENMTPWIQNCSNCSQALVMELNITKAIVLSFVLSIFVIFGVLGNILVILSVACHRSLRTVTHYFIVNLAVADLLLSSTVLPFSAIFEMLGRWVFGRVFCDIWAAMDVLCCTASIMSLCVISVDRYIGVSYPLRHPAIVTEKRALLALMGIWALSITISIGPLFGWKEPAPENEYVCKITEEPGYAIFSAVGSFYLPLVVILVMYCRVYVVARRETCSLRKGHKTEKAHHAEAVTLRIHRGNTSVVEEETLRSRTHFTIRLLKFSREKKAAKTLGIVVGCFVLCWLPFFLVLPIGSILPAYRPSDTVFKITFWLGYFNSCINPIIYPCSSQEFKKAFLSVLGVHCLRRSTRPTYPLCQGHAASHTQSNLLSLGSETRSEPSHLSPSSSVILSCTPSSSPVGGLGVSAGVSAGAKAAGVCSKNLVRMCCCVGEFSARTQPPACHSLPVIKVHQLSLCENGEAV